MLDNVIEYYFYKHLEEKYNIKKYTNYFDMQDKMQISMYVKKNNLRIETSYSDITIYQQEKKIAVAPFVFGNLISKYNNRRIPKTYTKQYL